MSVQCVIGAQWGDEGKGKIVDLLGSESDYVVRYQGGGNAGHTVVVGKDKLVLHLVPSGILHPGVTCVIGNGVVVDLAQFFEEVQAVESRGFSVAQRLFVSDRAHVVMPYHKIQDEVSEASKGADKIGTTKRGIGPCYADKVARNGIRMVDLLDPPLFEARLRALLAERNNLLKSLYGAEPLSPERVLTQFAEYRERIRPFVADTTELVNRAIRQKQRVMFEGAQGTLLDVDFGTYPFVTSSSSDALGIGPGTGVSPRRIEHVLGVTKAYTTRVGSGPFPTELNDRMGEILRERGEEFGATTGRPRRCGWFDSVACRFAVEINGIDGLAITKLDVLDAIDPILVCVAYEIDGRRVERFPSSLRDLERLKPVYESLPGWNAPTTGARGWNDLPARAREYLEYLSAKLETPIEMVSVGQERNATIRMRENRR